LFEVKQEILSREDGIWIHSLLVINWHDDFFNKCFNTL